MDSYWLKTNNESHKEQIKKANDEILMNSLDKYWEDKDKKTPATTEDKPTEEAKE